MHALQNYIAGLWNHWVAQIPPYLLLLFDQRQICDVRATFAKARLIGRLTTNLGKTLIEKYSEIDNTEIFLK